MCFYRVALFKLHIRNFYIVTRVQSAVQADCPTLCRLDLLIHLCTSIRYLTFTPIALTIFVVFCISKTCWYAVWGLFKKSVDTLSDLTFANFLSIYKSNWLAHLDSKGIAVWAWRTVPSGLVCRFCVNSLLIWLRIQSRHEVLGAPIYTTYWSSPKSI